LKKFATTPLLNNLTLSALARTLSDLLAFAKTLKLLDWLVLVLLLDEILRNCFRGPDVKITCNTFDLLSLEITFRAIKNNIRDSLEIRYYVGYHLWIYLPL